MSSIVDFLDSPAHAKSVTRGEHVVLCFRLAQDRDPSAEEFIVLSELYGGPGFTPSQVLATALRGAETETSWEQCRLFLARHGKEDFRVTDEIRAAAARIVRTCLSQIDDPLLPETPYAPDGMTAKQDTGEAPVPNEEYNVYYGYLHAHSDLSHGTGTAPEAYAHARDLGHMDYFGLTDHAELVMLWPWEHKWQQMKDAANAAYVPGQYVTFWGFEWSNPILGHMNVINSNDMTNCLAHFRLRGMYNWLSKRPEAFGLFNHPGLYDPLALNLRHLRRDDTGVKQMVGIEVANWNQSFDRYYYSGSWNSDFSYWDEGNLKGWRLGPTIGQDNHFSDWGTLNSYRTAVLAKELTREAVIGAYRSRRFYATENDHLILDFRCNGYPMGSELRDVNRSFTVKASTAQGESFKWVRLFRDGELLQAREVDGNPVETSFSDEGNTEGAYYYVIVTEDVDTDGNGRNDEAISAPIWIDGGPPPPNCSAFLLGISANPPAGNHGDLMVLLVALTLLAAGTRLVPAAGRLVG